MPALEDSIRVAASPADVFDLTQDYGLRLEWDPFLRDIRFLDGATEAAPGVKVWVRAWTGLTMTVEYVSVAPPQTVAMRMVEGPFFLRKFAGSWRFVPHDGGRVEVVFRYSFETRWSWARWLLDPVIARVFRRDVRARLRGLRRGIEEEGLLERLRRS